MFQSRKSGGVGRPSTPRSRTSNTSLRSIHLEDTANRNSSIGPKDVQQQNDPSGGKRKSGSQRVMKRFVRDDENCDPNPPAKRPRTSLNEPLEDCVPSESSKKPSGRRTSAKKVNDTSSGPQAFFKLLSTLKAQENDLPPRFKIDECKDLDDEDLRKMHQDWEREEPTAATMNALKTTYEGGPACLYAAVLRLEAHPIGYILFAKRATALGTVSTDPPSKLVHLYVNPGHRQQGHGSRIMHWFMTHHVKAVRHFSVLEPNFPMRMLLKKPEYKELTNGLGEGLKRDYISYMD